MNTRNKGGFLPCATVPFIPAYLSWDLLYTVGQNITGTILFFFAIWSFVSDIWAKREQINAKNYLCRKHWLQICFVPFSGPWTSPPGISWAYGEICVLLMHLFSFKAGVRSAEDSEIIVIVICLFTNWKTIRFRQIFNVRWKTDWLPESMLHRRRWEYWGFCREALEAVR